MIWLESELREEAVEAHEPGTGEEPCTDGTRGKGLWWYFGEGRVGRFTEEGKIIGNVFSLLKKPKVIRI